MKSNVNNTEIHNTPLSEERQGEALTLEMPQEGMGFDRQFYIESYGCQMNFNDSEIVASILNQAGYKLTKEFKEADLILLNTCSIREKAEERIRARLTNFKNLKKRKKNLVIGVLGCMAERLKQNLLEQEQLVDVVCGPDAYRDLPRLVDEASTGQKSVNVLLSREETYADVSPVRLDAKGVSAYISIMRGCDNMCSFCVVPFTRGRERSRNAFSIIAEAQDLSDRGYKEINLLGQNVDSYKWTNPETKETTTFAQLLEMTALVNPNIRVRFSTSHPKDINDDVIHTIAKHDNICKYIHLPIQSGSSRVLDLMNRTYDREWYLEKVATIRRIIPDCAISTDMISGFCTETEEDHQATLSLMEAVKFEMAYMYFYSERPGTLAARKYEDDVPLEVKKRRLAEVIKLQHQHSEESNLRDIGKVFKVLVEKTSKKSKDDLCGRNDQNKTIIFPRKNVKVGELVDVLVTGCTKTVLLGELV